MHLSRNSDDDQKNLCEIKIECPKPLVVVETFKFTSKIEISEPSSKVLSCNQCDRTFKFRNSLVKHVNAVHNDMVYECNICKSSFAYFSNLKRHKEKEHSSSIVRYHCSECALSFTYKHNLKTHIRKFHDREM